MARTSHSIWPFAALLAIVFSMTAAQPAAAGTQSFEAVGAKGASVMFQLGELRGREVRSATVRVGRYSRSVAVPRVRRAATNGRLWVHVPRAAVRVARARASRARSSRLVVVTRGRGTARKPAPAAAVPEPAPPSAAPSPAAPPSPAPAAPSAPVTPPPAPTPAPLPGLELPPAGPVSGRLATFEAGDWSEVANRSHTANASIDITGERAYDGANALKISYDGQRGNVFSRVWHDVDWQPGSDVWYGAAFYVPDPSKLRWTDLIRWDNYLSYGGGASGETGGLLVEDGKLSLKRSNYDGTNFAHLTDPVAVPAGRWFWVEVHQRLSAVPGEALNELYIDNRKVGSSTEANSRGRRIDTLRYGYVYNFDEGGASTLYMDRVSLTDGRRGPLS